MNRSVPCAVLLGISLVGGGNPASAGDSADAVKELAPSGTLTVGIVEAPNAGAFFITKDRMSGQPSGVTVDLGAELARKMGVPVAYRIYPNSGECTEAASSGAVDVAFMPVDEERRSKVAFGPAYYLLESTYLVSGASGIESLAEVDQARVRIVGIANTTTIRAATRTLKNTVPIPARSVDEAVGLMRTGRADALALSRDSLRPILAELPGSRILEGGFQQTSISIAVPRNRPAALAYVTDYLERAKASGLVRQIFDKAGLQDEAVAPAGR